MYKYIPKDLTELFLKVTLNTSKWVGSVRDEIIGSEIKQSKGASEKSGNFTKKLSQHQAVKDVDTAFRNLRIYFHEHTLPWNRKNRESIIQAEKFTEFTQQIQLLELECQKTLDNLYRVWDDVIDHAQKQELGQMFDPSNYPPLDILKTKYKIEFTHSIIANPDDIRVKTSQEVIARLKDEINKNNITGQNVAMEAFWKKLYLPVQRMAETLKDPESKFHDTLVNNIFEVIGIMKDFNIIHDPEIDAFIKNMEQTLCLHNPDDLRHDKKIRKNTADAAKDFADKMAGFMVPTQVQEVSSDA